MVFVTVLMEDVAEAKSASESVAGSQRATVPVSAAEIGIGYGIVTGMPTAEPSREMTPVPSAVMMGCSCVPGDTSVWITVRLPSVACLTTVMVPLPGHSPEIVTCSVFSVSARLWFSSACLSDFSADLPFFTEVFVFLV